MLRLLVAIAFAVNGAVALAQSSLLLASFNVESDADTQAELVAADMVRLSPLHIWALQEVADQAVMVEAYLNAFSQFVSINQHIPFLEMVRQLIKQNKKDQSQQV